MKITLNPKKGDPAVVFEGENPIERLWELEDQIRKFKSRAAILSDDMKEAFHQGRRPKQDFWNSHVLEAGKAEAYEVVLKYIKILIDQYERETTSG